MDADQVGRLRDILDATRLICSYVAGADESVFRRETQRQDAVIRRIDIIGEATLHLSDDTRQALPQLPYRRMRGMRNVLAHDYAGVNLEIVWEVATIYVPELRSILEQFFADQS
ncbi:MAG: DUF86 domain-containing protein [Vicinamibacterales bacterium]|nr:DUF86 domain-containing protein [Vicinamibacterales bacterium]